MNKYRITKYNPLFREVNGRYLKDEWTSISDIGKKFEGLELSLKSYKKVEDAYINSIKLIMQYLSVNYLTVDKVIRSFSYDAFQDLIKDYQELYTNDILDIYLRVKDRNNLIKAEIDSFCRLLLREDIGAEVYHDGKLKVYIGYDYLMSIHSVISLEKIIPEIEKLGLFVEKY